MKIAVIAHDKMKPVLFNFLKERSAWLWGKEVVATGRTAESLDGPEVSVEVIHLKKGESGGYLEITEMIVRKEIAMVLFFRDPSINQSYHADIQALLDACDTHLIPLATNPAAAELLILGQIKKGGAVI